MLFSKKSAAVLCGVLISFFSYARAEETAAELDPNGPWMICNISVDGLKNIRKKSVTKAAHSKKGKLYERITVTEDVQDISALGSFDSVEIDISPMPGTRKEKESECACGGGRVLCAGGRRDPFYAGRNRFGCGKQSKGKDCGTYGRSFGEEGRTSLCFA